MNQITAAISVAVGLFAGIMIMLEVGRRIGARRISRDAEGARSGTGAIEGAVFALLGLLIAFTFSGAASRFDERRDLIIQEANDIGTAYLRLDLLPVASQPALRQAFREYVDSRLETYRKLPDLAAAYAELAKSVALQRRIWSEAVVAVHAEGAAPDAAKLLLPALNAMIDISSKRTLKTQLHPPAIIYGMLCVFALGSAVLAGSGMAGARRRSWLHLIGFAAVLAISVFVIIDIEFPRLGFIRVDAFDKALVDVLEGMR